jgi:ribonuclease HII
MAGAPYRLERRAWRSGLTRVAGVDEAGRGPLAGPVVAAAVMLAPAVRLPGLADSKDLSPARRHVLFEAIRAQALGVGIGLVDAVTIDRINILEATRLAMTRALAALPADPELVLTDFVSLPGLRCPQRNLVRGERRSASVAAASIVAKVTRDRIMEDADQAFPQYGFGRHKGYPTERHRRALLAHGPCPLHRRTFHGVWLQAELFPERAAP